ncbi:protein YIF1B-B isoform X1 [Neodiprion virginianus]|uniref:protein YIF1B-B isoform X1 n=2 Tax=Neodiprion fabricii TaxID=2872261 RepID=UPI001ED9389F|nr:protein YIF1B-B isoform X1 [Neodiprion fabricii]XP_046628057.1 protein YIF1B-B isoform X1 [Neodiprion virginianus]
MNYNHSGARRGKPKRMLDPSVGLSSPAVASPTLPMAQSPYMYNQQQIPSSNGPQPDYGFNVAEQPPPPYGFTAAPSHQQTYNPNEMRQESFPGPQYATQLLAEPIVTNMAVQYGSALVGSGKQQLEKYVPVTALKYYFAVDTDYVISKLVLLFFPFTHSDWSIKYEQDSPLQPRYERNAPDMYIPTMAYLTYIVVAGLALGTQERFTPEQLGILASSALAWGIMELLVHTITLYVMNMDTSLKTLDLLAYCGYKYVGINFALLVSLPFQRFGYYVVLAYFSVSLAFFLVRSLKLRVIPEGHSSYSASGNKRRLYFILFVATIQPVLMWWLSSHLVASAIA